MDVERSLKRISKPAPQGHTTITVRGLRALYLEDLSDIYYQVEQLQKPLLDRKRHGEEMLIGVEGEIATLKNRYEEEIAEGRHSAETNQFSALESECHEVLTRAIRTRDRLVSRLNQLANPIRMRGENFELESLEQVEKLKRRGLREFVIQGEYGSFELIVRPSLAHASIADDSGHTKSVMKQIEEILTRRRNRVDRFLENRFMLAVWFAAVTIAWVAALSTDNRTLDYVRIFLSLVTFPLTLIVLMASKRDLYAVIPLWQSQASESFADRHGVPIALSTITVFAMFITALISRN
jgi:hypothetical protein